MNNRKSLTKSLHTVTAVSRVACYVRGTINGNDPEQAVRMALDILGQPNDWRLDDATFYACVRATIKGIA